MPIINFFVVLFLFFCSFKATLGFYVAECTTGQKYCTNNTQYFQCNSPHDASVTTCTGNKVCRGGTCITQFYYIGPRGCSAGSCLSGLGARCASNGTEAYYDDSCCGSGKYSDNGWCVSGCRDMGSGSGVAVSSTQYGYGSCFKTSPTNCGESITGSASAFASSYNCDFNAGSYCVCTSSGWSRRGPNGDVGCEARDTSGNTPACASGYTSTPNGQTPSHFECTTCGNSDLNCYKKTPINGVCDVWGGSLNNASCTKGTYNANPGDTYVNRVATVYRWTCDGIDGGSDAVCSQNVRQAPCICDTFWQDSHCTTESYSSTGPTCDTTICFGTMGKVNASCGTTNYNTCATGNLNYNPPDVRDASNNAIGVLWTCDGVCSGTTVSNCCDDIETTAAFCARVGKNCGSVTALDNCGKSRTENCGSCAIGSTCTNNVCAGTKIDGGWSGTTLGACSVTCGTGTQSWWRTCNSPTPANGGAACVGAASGTQSCDMGCCPVNGVNGVCGSANGAPSGNVPVYGLCIFGNPSGVVTNTGTYDWTCVGTNGSCTGTNGTDASCSAPISSGPTYTPGDLIIKNSGELIVSIDAGKNQICEPQFGGSRVVKFTVTGRDINGPSDITNIQLRWNGTEFTRTSLVNGVAIFDVNFPAALNNSGTFPLQVSMTDASGLTTGWIDTERLLKIWDCNVPVSGALYDGSNAVLGSISCANAIPDFTTKVDGSKVSYDLEYTGRTMTVTSPNYGGDLIWGASYAPKFTNTGGISPVMRYPANNTCNNGLASFTVDTNAQIGVNPYAVNPTLVINFSAQLAQEAWFQTSGGGVVAKDSITDNIPATCVAPCVPKVILNGGLVAAGRNLNILDGVTDWSINKNVVNTNYSYKYFLNEYYIKLGQGKAYTSDISMSEIILDTGGKGVVLVKGDVIVDVGNTVPVGSFLMIGASGNINVNIGVSNMQGIFVTDKSFISAGSSDSKLIIDGSVYSRKTVTLTRGYFTKTFNNTNPSILVNYRPDFIFSMPGKLTKILSGWREGT